MQVRDELLNTMSSRLDIVAEQITANEVRLSLLGSYASDAMRMELYLLVRTWGSRPALKGGTDDVARAGRVAAARFAPACDLELLV